MDSRDSVRCTVGVPTQSYLPRLPRLVSITYVVKKVSLHTGKARAPAYTSYNNITSRYFNKHCAFAVSTYVCMMTTGFTIVRISGQVYCSITGTVFLRSCKRMPNARWEPAQSYLPTSVLRK